MKELDGWVKIKKYTDDEGKPVCGDCFMSSPCAFYKDVEITPDTAANEPGPRCPVWHGESKSESAMAEAVAAECERCAKVVESMMATHHDVLIAEAIRRNKP